jgi:ribosome-associated translation inhibitor RaiA
MKIQINTDDHAHGGEALAASVSAMVEQALGRFAGDITRVEVHMSDENGSKGGENDKRCMIEVRLEGRKPAAVVEHAATMKQAVHGATSKLVRMLDSTLGRLNDHRKNAAKTPPELDSTPM